MQCMKLKDICKMIIIKNNDEIELMRKSALLVSNTLTAAAKSIGRTPACVSTDIIYQRPRDNFLFQYID